jgi:hypothetical protein
MTGLKVTHKIALVLCPLPWADVVVHFAWGLFSGCRALTVKSNSFIARVLCFGLAFHNLLGPVSVRKDALELNQSWTTQNVFAHI